MWMQHRLSVNATLLCAGPLTLSLLGAGTAQQDPRRAVQCRPAGALVRVADLSEASGIAASRRNPGRAWAHNDSGEPVLIALDARGAVAGRVRVTGATVEDWEAIAVGACGSATCIYVADIGDNDAQRKQITIYRFPEPDSSNASVAVQDVFQATYPDGAQDAETLLVTPKGDILVVTKGETGPVAVYRLPRDAKPGGTATMERLGKPRDSAKAPPNDRITDGAVSPDGAWVVLRTNRTLYFYSAADFAAGNWREAGRFGLEALNEPQGEGVTFADDATLALVGEGSGKSEGGTFARVTCTFANENPGR
jgi:hypothetical protein